MCAFCFSNVVFQSLQEITVSCLPNSLWVNVNTRTPSIDSCTAFWSCHCILPTICLPSRKTGKVLQAFGMGGLCTTCSSALKQASKFVCRCWVFLLQCFWMWEWEVFLFVPQSCASFQVFLVFCTVRNVFPFSAMIAEVYRDAQILE